MLMNKQEEARMWKPPTVVNRVINNACCTQDHRALLTDVPHLIQSGEIKQNDASS